MHSLLRRREFLKYSALLPCAVPWVRALGLAGGAGLPRRAGRILLVLELNGGNDGLSTVVPFRDEGYGRHRTTLRIPEKDLLKLDDTLGLHPALRGLATLHERGELAIVQGVGYPEPNFSHEVSLDVWHTARLDRTERRGIGWLGRVLDGEIQRASDAATGGGAPRALLAGPHALPRALRARRSPVATVPSIASYLEAGDVGTESLLEGELAAEMAEHVRRVLVDARATAKSLAAIANGPRASKPYPASKLGDELELISQLIRGGFDTPVYYAIQEGFDSHSLQAPGHTARMQVLGDALLAFLTDMRELGRGGDVLVLVFSEFGRRVQENASRGTDHGTAGPVFLAGAPVRPGVHGATPSLSDLDDGNLKSTVDFRRVYASVLRDWMGVDAQEVLGAEFEPLPLLRG